MDIIALLRIVAGLILLLVVPGYALSFVFFPVRDQVSIGSRIAITFVLSLAAVIVTMLMLDLVLGVDTTAGNIVGMIVVITVCAAIFWFAERIYLGSPLRDRVDTALAAERQVVTIDISALLERGRGMLAAIRRSKRGR